MQKSDQYVKISVAMMGELVNYLKQQPWHSVNPFLVNFEGLLTYQDDIKPEPKEKKAEEKKAKPAVFHQINKEKAGD